MEFKLNTLEVIITAALNSYSTFVLSMLPKMALNLMDQLISNDLILLSLFNMR